MDFFIRPGNTVLSSVLYVGGNMLFSYVMKKYLCIKNKPELVIDELQKYMNKAKQTLTNTFKQDNTEANANIEKEFYIIDDYINVMKDSNNKLEQIWKLRTLIEYTPKSNIVMYYDPYKQGFSYYADIQPISYDILNAVAMKYVTRFRCRDFFVDNEVTQEYDNSPFIQIHMTEKPKKKDSDSTKTIDGPFVKLKKNNNTNANKDDKDNTKQKNIYQRNKFIYIGRFRNYSILTKPQIQNKSNGFHSSLLNNLSTETQLQKEVMDYKKFKNRQTSK
jgi:hypothetical protein